MSERQNYIRGDEPADQALTAEALRRMAAWFDLADDRRETVVYPAMGSTVKAVDDSRAWMWTALLIADMCDIPTAELHKMANAISLGVQGELAH